MNKKIFKNKEYYSTLFSTEVKLFKPEKSNELLASLTKLAEFLPSDINYEQNIDLVPIAFDAFVANRRNKNNQVIGTNKALEIVDNFKYKFIDIEHNRENLIGVILTVGFTSFGENSEPLTREQVQDMDEPFNVVCGGVIWPIVDEELVSRIQESSNELSKIYKKIGASWELLSSNLEIAVFDPNEKNLINATIDKDRKYEEFLITAGGNGKSKDGKIICDLISGETLPVGMGLTTNPAAEVEGVLAGSDKLKDKKENIEASDILISNILNTDKFNVWSNDFVSKKDFTALKNDFDKIIANFKEKNIEKPKNTNKDSVEKDKDKRLMIKSISDITDENLQTIQASDIHQVHDRIVKELQEKSAQYVEEKKQAEIKFQEQEASAKQQAEELVKYKTQVDELVKQLDDLKAAEAIRVAEENFNSRMEILSTEFDLSADAKKVIAKKLQSIETDEQFLEYKEELSAYIPTKQIQMNASASNTDGSEKEKEVLANALSNGDNTDSLPNSSSPNNEKQQKWANASKGIVVE